MHDNESTMQKYKSIIERKNATIEMTAITTGENIMMDELYGYTSFTKGI